jgi:competence transcription factor ComK
MQQKLSRKHEEMIVICFRYANWKCDEAITMVITRSCQYSTELLIGLCSMAVSLYE